MGFAWFIYTLAIMVVAIAACAVNMTVWVLAGRRDCLAAAAGFLSYTLDVGVILYDEYVRLKPLGEEYFEQGLTHPAFQVLLTVMLVACVWSWAFLRLGLRPTPRVGACALAVLGVVLAVVAPTSQRAGVVRTLAYWSLRDLAIIGALVWIAWRYATSPSESERADLRRHRRPFLLAAALAVLMLVEDMLNILFLRPDLTVGWIHDLLWYLTGRNISENLLMLVAAVSSIVGARNVMRVFARHPAHDEQTLDHERVRPDFESRLLSYTDSHGMSNREREVLALLLQGRDIQNIASELVISTGTVKAHLHRIYKKAGVNSRQELVETFWQG